MGLEFGVDFEVGESEDGEDEGELGDADAGGAKGVEDEPRVGEPGDFGEDEAVNQREKVGVFGAGLDEDVVGGGVAEQEGGGNEQNGVSEGGENAGGGGAEQDGDKSLDNRESGGGAGLNQD